MIGRLSRLRHRLGKGLRSRYTHWAPRGGVRGWIASRNAATAELPTGRLEEGLPWGYQLDHYLELDGRAAFLVGWAHDRRGPLQGLELLSPHRASSELLTDLSWVRRPDVEATFGECPRPAGFLGMVKRWEHPERHRAGRIRVRNAAGEAQEFRLPPPVRDPFEVRERLLHHLPAPRDWSAPLVRDHVVPALEALAESCRRQNNLAEVHGFGPKPSAKDGPPEVSVVVVAGAGLPMLEHQLAQLVDDPELAGAELLYILDGQGDSQEVLRRAEQLAELYGRRLRVGVLSHPATFGNAANLGAQASQGKTLLFLDPQALPAGPGWLAGLRAQLEEQGGGAVGPKLLYGDGSIRSCGLAFTQDLFPTAAWNGWLWYPEALFQGFPQGFPAAMETRAVPALPASGLLISRQDFEEVEGFGSGYATQAGAGAGLCLRLQDAGQPCRVVPEACLHVLGADPAPDGREARLAHLDAWIQTERWYKVIEHHMKQLRGAQDEAEPAA